jgi:hypothetical protein
MPMRRNLALRSVTSISIASISPTYVTYTAHGEPLWSDRMCSGDTLDDLEPAEPEHRVDWSASVM